MSETTFIIEEGRHDIVMQRSFAAPRETVFDVYTDPAFIPQWWGPAKYTVTVEKGDIKTGGSWRFITRVDDDTDIVFHGVFHEVAAPRRIVQTFQCEPEKVILETATLEEQEDGTTLLTARSVFSSVEERDEMVATGMEWGARESMERLNALIQKQL